MDDNEESKPEPSPFAPAEYSSIPPRSFDVTAVPAAPPVVEPEPSPEPVVESEPVIVGQEDLDSESHVPEATPVPDTYMAPTNDGSGFINTHAYYKQITGRVADISFDISALTGEERRVLSFRLAELNVRHQVEGLTLLADPEAATTVQGLIDQFATSDPFAVERDEPEEITVPESTDVDDVIEHADEDEDEIVFDLLSLSTEERRHLSMRLTGAGINHIWEVATDLVVSVKDAPLIERYIQEVQNPDGFADEEIAEFESDEDVDDEEIYAAMSGLYVAADKLMQKAKDPAMRTAFYDAVDDVDGLPAPFGFDPRVWTQVQEIANAIADLMDQGADDDTVANDARTLRQLLVNYV